MRARDDGLSYSRNTWSHAVMGNTTTWRLEVDGGRCDRHGICAVCCPERIELDEWGFAIVSREAISAASTLRRARRAVAACPAGALSLQAIVDAPSGERR